jgi:hyperosmotically inducible protein
MKASMVCLVAMLTVTAAAAQAAQQATPIASDTALDSRIETRIHRDPSLKKYDISVYVDGSVVALTGTVATEAERTKATQLATMKGVSRVDNKILVDLAAAGHPKGTTGKVIEKTKEAGEKTKEVAGKAVDKTKEGLSKTGEVITDGWITTRVKSKFIDEDLLKGSDINVDTNNHVVTLKGTVMSPAARARAVEQAKEVEGVHRVVDMLKIGPKK